MDGSSPFPSPARRLPARLISSGGSHDNAQNSHSGHRSVPCGKHRLRTDDRRGPRHQPGSDRRSDAGEPDGASGGRVNGLGVDRSTPARLYAASEWGGLFRSTRQRPDLGSSGRPRAHRDLGRRSRSDELQPRVRHLVLRRPRRRAGPASTSAPTAASPGRIPPTATPPAELLPHRRPGAPSRPPSASPSIRPMRPACSSAPTAASR